MLGQKKLPKPLRLIWGALLLALLVLGNANPTMQLWAATTVNIDPATRYQTIEGWGSSICWWGNQIGGWAAENRNKLIEQIVDPDNGLGYNIFRYNIGGGENPGHNHMRAYGEIEGYQGASGAWNWNADATQRAVLNRLIERGKAYGSNLILEAFSNSPPYWMTKSGCASGNTDGSNNLKDDYYDDFAEYLTEVVKHFQAAWGITFRTLEPLNEPNVSWWKANGSQEGCCFTVAAQQKIIKEVGQRLIAKGLTGTTVSAADENSIDTAVSGLNSYDATTLSYLSQVNTHSYSGTQRSQLRDLAKSKGKRLWQSESGPLGFSGELNDAVILMSQRITKDLKELQPVAWLDWQIIDGGNWGSIYVNDAAQTFTLTKKFYMHSNYSRFIRPGYTIIGTNHAEVVAAISPDRRKLVIVATNSSKTNSNSFSFNLAKFTDVHSTVTVYRTSPSLDLAKSNLSVVSQTITDYLPAYSINTYVVTLGAVGPTSTPLATPSASPINSPNPTPSGTLTGATVSYAANDWGSGASVTITIKNTSPTAINGWSLVWNFSGNQKITNIWNASYTQNGTQVTAKNTSYNATIPASATVSFGFNLSYSGSNDKPASFTLNGQACQVQ